MSQLPVTHTIQIESQGLVLDLIVPVVPDSITKTIGCFNDIWFGKFSRELFTYYFGQIREMTARQMTSINEGYADTLPRVEANNLENKLKMCRVARDIDKWQHPFTGYQKHGSWIWRTGTNRLLASGLCWTEPWQIIEAMLFLPKGEDVFCLVDSHQITDDDDLRQRLHIKENTTDMVISAVFEPDDQSMILAPGTISWYGQSKPPMVSRPHLDQFARWLMRQRDRRKLHIWTDWPELISDSIGWWDWQHAGPGPSDKINRTSIDGEIWQKRQLAHGPDGEHDLYVFEPRHIDLTDFLFWMDLDHTLFYQNNWDFVLSRRSSTHLAQMIEISRLK